MSDNVLVLSAGRRVSLVKAFQKALIDLNVDGNVYGADLNPSMSAACNVLTESFSLPHVLSGDYAKELKKLCIDQSIRLVVPTIDTELLKLATIKDDFLSAGINIVVSDLSLVKLCRDKRLTHQLFDEIGFRYPETYSANDIKFPCFSKPISGSLSQNIRVLKDQLELDSWDVRLEEMMFMAIVSNAEFDEYTIDIYYSSDEQLKCIIPRQRVEVRGGEISKGRTNKRLVELLMGPMSKVKGAFGCLTLQVFKEKEGNQIYGIEVNPRFGGGFPLSNAAGGRYPEYLIREVILGEVVQFNGDWEDGLVMLRYDAEVLVSNG